jgi:MFS family permease
LPRSAETEEVRTGRSALRFVVLVGVVSLFADMTYEGARAITGPFLATLGASGAVVGVVAGLGELLGYALRLVSGYLSDRTGRYWALMILGYAVNMLAVPLLALAGRWEIAAGLMIAERVGKAIRTPPRDVMLSHASSRLGHGWAFGLHEALDQVGAVVGPLLVAGVLFRTERYDIGFAVCLCCSLWASSRPLGSSIRSQGPSRSRRRRRSRQAGSPGASGSTSRRWPVWPPAMLISRSSPFT